MKRTIKFRGFSIHSNEWMYGSLLKIGDNYHILGDNDMYEDGHHVRQESDKPTWVDPNTIGQFTGLLDKDGKEIYEGDIVEYYDTESYCINPDCDAHLLGYGTILRKKKKEVNFRDCMFTLEYEFGPTRPLSWCGLSEYDLINLKNDEEEDVYFDTNGYKLDKSILGIKVIGNIYEETKGGE